MADTRLTRREREKRAYVSGLVAAGGGLATVATFVVALITSLSFGIVLLCALVTVMAVLLFRRSVSP
jgi:hypothetical protein